MTRLGDQHVVFYSRAPAAFGNVHPGLDRNHHARLKLGGFPGKDQKSRIVIAKADVVAGVMGEERREPLGCDLVPRQRVDVASGDTGTYAIDRGLLRIFGDSEYLPTSGFGEPTGAVRVRSLQ